MNNMHIFRTFPCTNVIKIENNKFFLIEDFFLEKMFVYDVANMQPIFIPSNERSLLYHRHEGFNIYPRAKERSFYSRSHIYDYFQGNYYSNLNDYPDLQNLINNLDVYAHL